MLPRQEEMGENTPFTRKLTSEPLETLERVTTPCHIPKQGKPSQLCVFVSGRAKLCFAKIIIWIPGDHIDTKTESHVYI